MAPKPLLATPKDIARLLKLTEEEVKRLVKDVDQAGSFYPGNKKKPQPLYPLREIERKLRNK